MNKRVQSQAPASESLEFAFMVESPDSDIEAVVEGTLEEDAGPFFFGSSVSFLTYEQNERIRSDTRLPAVCRKPLITFTHQLQGLPVTIKVYRQRSSVA